jgi:L-seryl-tRNA(Ser) seleniumtransferase
VPVIVDAAGQLPPAENLQRFIAAGADLVAFSGGKAIGGPQASGILCGRRELIAAAALQHQDLDVMPELWNPPASLIDKTQLPGAPQHGIGRPCKVGKEEIAGLITALRLFIGEDPEERRGRWLGLMQGLVDACGAFAHAEIAVVADRKRAEVPTARLVLDEDAAGITALELVVALQDGQPRIAANPTYVHEGAVVFGPMCLKEGESAQIARRLGELLGG